MYFFEKTYDKWTWERLSRHVLYWTFWLIFYGTINGTYHDNGYLVWLLFELVAMLIKLPYAYFVAYYLVPKFLPKKRYLTIIFCTILLAFISLGLIIKLNSFFPYEMGEQPTNLWSGKAFYRTLDLIYIASLLVIINMGQKYFQQIQLNAKLREEKVNAELQILKNQLQPHFLFNTLNNIYGMVLSGEKKAADSILQLSNIISYMLYECNDDLVELDKEVNMLKNYIQLEKIRYGQQLDHSFEIHGEMEGRRIAPFLLISFVENAYKHGVSNNIKQSWIRTVLQVQENTIIFIVENAIPDDQKKNTVMESGIGLENVKKRLQLMYPNRHKLSITKADSFLINLTISL